MNGKVCRSARIKKAYAIHLWKTWSLSCETPVNNVIQFVLLAVALDAVSVLEASSRLMYQSHKTNGMHARLSQPDLVASAGESP
jgi:hypothetical protein